MRTESGGSGGPIEESRAIGSRRDGRTGCGVPGLRTDFYELTMMNGYLQAGIADRRGAFDLFVRSIPERGGYCIAAGLEAAVEFLREARFSPAEIAYLREQELFCEAFLERLRDFRFRGDLLAFPEGTLVFPLEPILRVQGTLFEAQFVESALLNAINFETLIATKAARVCQEAGENNVIEFGMRRAHGVDGALSATRAAYVGGVAATSNTEAGHRLGIPVRGTQAHSWIMAFEDELSAFRAYAESYPESSILLVDTYDTLESGIPNAIRVGHELAQRGYRLQGIRLDSGDLAYLSIRAREMLDQADLHETKIVASGDLDEWIIHDLNVQGARIDTWGVGTRLVTSHGEPALTGVYKLAAIEEDGHWSPRLKIAERGTKSTIPGLKQVWRLQGAQSWWEADLIGQEDESLSVADGEWIGFHPLIEYESKRYTDIQAVEPLLVPVMRGGELVGVQPSLEEIRRRTRAQLAQLHPTSRRLLNAHIYKVSLTERTLRMRQELRRRWGAAPER
ncbi:MAG: nicotinate phosphoribosyltransferase [Candidatus Eisenbacteria sp.]|nr:nicotinate phosphoribosyltransferase [Candidatus Eisenbacteria bacterium]